MLAFTLVVVFAVPNEFYRLNGGELIELKLTIFVELCCRSQAKKFKLLSIYWNQRCFSLSTPGWAAWFWFHAVSLYFPCTFL